MPEIDVEGTREALSSWATASSSGKAGILCINEKQKRLEFVDLTRAETQKREKAAYPHSLTAIADFMHKNFDSIVKTEDLTSESMLKKACEQLEKHVVKETPHKKGFLTERLKSKMAESLQDAMIQDLEANGGYSRAKATIQGIVTLYKHRDQIAKIPDEKERNTIILSLTNLTPESGFCVGNTYEERLSNLEEKLSLLKNSYEEAKKKRSVDEYFSEGFKSDPCFNGRMIALIDYVSKKQSLPEEVLVEGLDIPNKDVLALSDLYYAYRDAIKDTGESPSQTSFLDYIKKSDGTKTFEIYYTNKAVFKELYKTISETYIE